MPVRVLAFVLLLPYGCSDIQEDSVIASAAAQRMQADQVMFDVQQVITSEGVRRGLLHADTAYVYEDSGRVELRRVKLDVFNTGGTRTADLTARGGTLDTRSQKMIARGSVVLNADGGKVIRTEELHYDPNAHRVWSNVTTTMVENGNPLTGDGFSADDQMRNIQITRPRGRITTGGGLKF